MKFLVAGLRHELLPIAHRLRREGHDVASLVWRARYEGAWGGNIEKIAKHSDGTLDASALVPWVEQAAAGEVTVVTTVRRVAEQFHAAPKLFAMLTTESEPQDRLLLGGWFDGEAVQCPHLLVADWGVWAGGLGPHLLGGVTLIRVQEMPGFVSGAVTAATERMKSESFRGLFHLDVEEQLGTGELRLRGLAAGWPWLHVHAFVAELKSLSETLGGAPPTLLHKYVSVLPVTVPPWPNEKQQGDKPGTPVEGLTVQQQGQLFWHDISVDTEHRRLVTAGLDGMLCVATGASDSTPALARAKALDLASKLQVPAKQHRWDAFALVDSVLSTLEDRYGFVV